MNSRDLDSLAGRVDQVLAMEFGCYIDFNEVINHNILDEPLEKKLKLNETEETDINSGNITELITKTVKQLEEHLERAHDAMATVMIQIEKVYNEERSEADELADTVNKKLEVPFTKEDARLQAIVKVMRESIWSEVPENGSGMNELTMKGKEGLITVQKYRLLESSPKGSLCDRYDLIVEKEVSLKCIGFEERMPIITSISLLKNGGMYVFFTLFDELNDDTKKLLKPLILTFDVVVKIWEKRTTEDSATTETLTIAWIFGNRKPLLVTGTVSSGRTHFLKMRVEHKEECTQWSNTVEFIPEFSGYCTWKECPDYAIEKRKYSVDVKNPRIATFIGDGWNTNIGNTPLPRNNVTSWSIKILKSRYNNGDCFFIGVAPSDINKNEDDNYNKCGWYFDCYSSTLYSGPPHKNRGKEYGQRKGWGKYVREGDSVGVVMDTAKGELSFAVNEVNYGVAYEGIPLDKPLVPCVFLEYNEGDSVELDTSEVKENVDSSIPFPSNIMIKSTTWDSITLTWDAVERASFYQIEVDGNKFWDAFTTNRFTKRRFLSETEHIFRVRAAEGNSVSEWSDVVKGKTLETPDFSECNWKKCSDYVDEEKKYSVDEKNPRIATKRGDGYGCCTIIGNTPLPLNKVTSWNIKLLKFYKGVYGEGIYIGVASFDIDQNEVFNYNECGWYFDCYHSVLRSGPPHNYRDKVYGSRKEWGDYVHTGDNIGVVMDTGKGDLSFALNEVSLGVAYEGIPLDKPLVPCVILGNKGDSVEFVI